MMRLDDQKRRKEKLFGRDIKGLIMLYDKRNNAKRVMKLAPDLIGKTNINSVCVGDQKCSELLKVKLIAIFGAYEKVILEFDVQKNFFESEKREIMVKKFCCCKNIQVEFTNF